jgi:hypothetical protein
MTARPNFGATVFPSCCALSHTCSEASLFWSRSQISDIRCGDVSRHNKFRIELLPAFECSVEGLHHAYAGEFGFVKDGIDACAVPCLCSEADAATGLLFYHKATRYTLGSTPLVLVWYVGDAFDVLSGCG